MPIFDDCQEEKSTHNALESQIGGSHYKDFVIQPTLYCHANNIGFHEGNVIKYVSRWRKKNGIQDLEKAKETLEQLIEMERYKQNIEMFIIKC